jgi:hypothetical protein
LTTASIPIKNNAKQKFDKDADQLNTCFDDDSDIICNVVTAHVGKSRLPDSIITTSDGNLVCAADAESMEVNLLKAEEDKQITKAPLETEELGPGKRKRQANTLYKSSLFWRYHDKDDPEIDM